MIGRGLGLGRVGSGFGFRPGLGFGRPGFGFGRPGFGFGRPGFGFGRGGFLLPFTLGAALGAAATPNYYPYPYYPYNPYYPYPYYY